MANLDSPKGFIPSYMENGAGLPGYVELEHTTGTAVFRFDLLVPSGGNYVSATAASDNPTHIAMEYVAASEATGTLFLAIPIVPGLVCECQADAAALSDSSSNGSYFDATIAAGSTATGLSAMELDDNASAEDMFILVDRVKRPDNAWGEHVDVYVKIRVNADAQVIATT